MGIDGSPGFHSRSSSVGLPDAFDDQGARRLHVRYLCDVLGCCKSAHAGSGPPALASVVNVSRGGIGLLTNQRFDAGGILALELPLAGGRLLACVVHCAARPEGWWALGCSFVVELDDDELHCFGTQPHKSAADDRRSSQRVDCDLRATYRPLGVGERQRWHARVADISMCGIRLVTDRAIDVGRPLRLEIHGGADYGTHQTLACVVRVERGAGSEWIWGCGFMREFTLRQLRGLVPYVIENPPGADLEQVEA